MIRQRLPAVVRGVHWTVLSAYLVMGSHAGASGDLRPAIDVRHYHLDLRFPHSLDSLYARATLMMDLTAPSPDSVRLDFEGLTVDSVLVGGQTAAFRRGAQSLVIAIPQTLRDRGEITVVYHGVPEDGLILSQNKHGRRTIFADNWPNRAHYWFPGVDRPSDKASVDFRVVAPSSYDVIANGRRAAVVNNLDGSKTTEWVEDVPIPMYCIVVGVAEFSVRYPAVVQGVPFSYWVFPQELDAATRDFLRGPDMMQYYINLIGPYPYEKLSLVQSKTQFGGMENSSAIFLAENSIRGDGRVEGTVAHEIAHQWFGDSVTEHDWPELWLSEGFATYFSSLYVEFSQGEDAFRERMQRMKGRIFEYDARSGKPVIDTTVTNLMQLLNPDNYSKGAWVLHMLRGMLGDQQFFQGIRIYYDRHRNRTATTADLQEIMEEVSHRPLQWFFDQWLRRPGNPALEVAWHWASSEKQLQLEIKQTQNEEVFRFPLEVEFQADGKTTRKQLQIDRRVTRTNFPSPEEPSGLVIDPDGEVLMVATVHEQ